MAAQGRWSAERTALCLFVLSKDLMPDVAPTRDLRMSLSGQAGIPVPPRGRGVFQPLSREGGAGSLFPKTSVPQQLPAAIRSSQPWGKRSE